MDDHHIENLLEDSRIELASAHARVLERLYRKSVRDSYFAVYYAAKAGLGHPGIRTKSHQSVQNGIDRAIESGQLTPELLYVFMGLRNQRGSADYDYTKRDWTEEDARFAIGQAEKFINQIEELISNTRAER